MSSLRDVLQADGAALGAWLRPSALGRYELLTQLAAGGMATVYAGRARGAAGFERVVAIKRLHAHLSGKATFVDMLLDEARLAARIHHSNVVATLDVGGDRDTGYFLVMEYVEGAHLGALLRGAADENKRIAVPLVMRVMLDALAGLGAAHATTDDDGLPLGLVHRDISPHNLIVGADGVTRVTDFGVAKASGRIATTLNGTIKGKLAYMSPEQAAGAAVDQRSDLFAMGVVLWEALTQRRLFFSEDPQEIFRRILYEPLPALADFDPALAPLDPVLARALERDLGKRFSSAAAFTRSLERAAAQVGGVAPARAVAQVVERLSGEKLELERSEIRRAMRDGGPGARVTSTSHSRLRAVDPAEHAQPNEFPSVEPPTARLGPVPQRERAERGPDSPAEANRERPDERPGAMGAGRPTLAGVKRPKRRAPPAPPTERAVSSVPPAQAIADTKPLRSLPAAPSVRRASRPRAYLYALAVLAAAAIGWWAGRQSDLGSSEPAPATSALPGPP